MKNIVRAFALTLVATGAFASSHTTQTSLSTVVVGNFSGYPVPTCPPDGTTSCGMYKPH
jgi:spermidine/putrescine-binding protein